MMPIRASERARYPRDWKDISRRIRERDGDRCKWCQAPNGRLIDRDASDRAQWRLHAHLSVCVGNGCAGVRVVLTVAHLDHVPENCAEDNLVALCQRCHLVYDGAHHRKNAHATRRARWAVRELL